MKLFGRKKRSEEPEATTQTGGKADAAPETVAQENTTTLLSAESEDDSHTDSIPLVALDDDDPADRKGRGPWDATEPIVGDAAKRVDLGALRIPARENLAVRLDIDESSGQVTAVNLAIGQSAVQLQVFAAPKTEGIWNDIREEIVTQVKGSGGTADEVPGHFGREVIAKIPSRGANGQVAQQVARFAGVDGPRWFLRAVFSGPSAHDQAAATDLEEVIRGSVIVRGAEARAPRELLELQVPTTENQQKQAETEAEDDNSRGKVDLGSLGRGPEITQIG